MHLKHFHVVRALDLRHVDPDSLRLNGPPIKPVPLLPGSFVLLFSFASDIKVHVYIHITYGFIHGRELKRGLRFLHRNRSHNQWLLFYLLLYRGIHPVARSCWRIVHFVRVFGGEPFVMVWVEVIILFRSLFILHAMNGATLLIGENLFVTTLITSGIIVFYGTIMNRRDDL